MKEEQARFSERLRAALRDAGIEESAVALMKRFNSRYGGTSVTSQAVSGWLNGKSMPRQDKLRSLAELLDVDLHYLQTGEGKSKLLREGRAAWPESVTPEERQAIEAFLGLPEPSRRLVGQLIDALAKIPGKGAAKR
ncbi:helix-turn-helix domain-containing protein [Arenimonas daejeonensis]|uniref:helix-turn-helix domain-containing protein n=1 Tax=Arenimonas daejeonensis TaxID=370777 RepID=UPI0011BF3930|nr:helix-turn-helix domain-containing protein [Arenimonas daejeonensis]